MNRAIVGFHRDEVGDWVAELDCGHGRHVRHRPPFLEAPWVEDDAGRAGRLGTPIDCGRCDRAELPEGLEVVRRTATWDESTLPGGLRHDHRVAAGAWGLLVVEEGELGFHAATEPPIDVVLRAGDRQPIPPDVLHNVELTGPVRFHVDFLRA